MKKEEDPASTTAAAEEEEAEVKPVPENNDDKNDDKTSDAAEKSSDGAEKEGDEKDKKEGEEEEKAAPKPKVGFGQLFRFADGCDIFLIILGALGAIGVGGALPAFSFLFGDLVNEITDPDNDVAAVAVEGVALTFLWVGLGMFGGGFLRVFGLMTSAKRQTHRFRVEYLRHMLRQEVSWHDTIEGKEFTSKLADAATKFEAGISVKFGEAMTYIAAFITGIVIGFTQSWKLTLVILSLLPLAAILGAMFGKVMASAASEGAASYAKAGGVAEESIASIRTVTALNGQASAYMRYRGFLREAEASGTKSSCNAGALFGVFQLFMYGAYALAFWYGATLIIDPEDDISGGTVLTVFFCVLFGAMMIGQAGPAIQSIQEAQAVAFEAYEVIDRVPEVDIESGEGDMLENIKGHVEFKDIRFAYPSRPDAEVLKGISFSVAPGTSAALVGGSGCGKSTCMALLQRFYDPTTGQVLIDGVDLKSLNIASFRDHIGIVSQEPTLFATSIMDNIRYGSGANRVATDEEVIAASKDANIHDFIMSLPDQYDTSVGDQGIQLSGGQKQRVAIARALLRNPTILLLDEATSALDTQSERIVQAALDNLMAARTTIMIAHRLSTVRKASQIIVMELGNIIEVGTHDELAAKEGGVYAELAALQALHEKKQQDNPLLLKDETEETEENAEKVVVAEAPAEETPEEKMAKKMAMAKKSAEWNKTLMQMAFTNGCEYFKLIIACLMACVNGAVLPVFALFFTDMLTVFFYCTPIPLAATPCAAFGYLDTYYGCDQATLLDLFDPEQIPSASQCENITLSCSTTNQTICEEELLQQSINYSLYFLAIGAAAGISMFFQLYLFGDIGSSLTRRIRQKTFKALLRQDIGFFDDEEHSVGTLTTRLAQDAAVIEAAVSKNIGVLVQNVCTVIVALVIAFIAGWELTLVVLAMMPLLILGNIIETRSYMTAAKQSSASEARAGQVVSEAVRGVRTVASFGIQPNLIKLYDELMRGSYDRAFGTGGCAGLSYGYSQFIMFAIYTASFYYAAYLLRVGVYDSDRVMRVFFVMLLSAFSIGQAVGLNAEAARGQKAIPSIFGIIDNESKIDPTSKDGEVISAPVGTGVKGSIEFRDVKFTYPARKGRVLKGISFTVEPGETVALVGGSGSGKSTIFALLERFYDIEEGDGEIILDGKPLQSFNIKTLREILGTVEQEPRLFGTSIKRNLLFGNDQVDLSILTEPDNKDNDTAEYDLEKASDGEKQLERHVDAALDAANAASFIEQLPKKLDTHVGEQGKGQLSGGQKQRVAIARAILRDAPIMLLDEATSALDSESEKLVQEALNKIMEKRTTLVIAHRLSTIQDADKILVLDKGRIVERGNHQQLLELDGIYANLCREQSMATA